jgi:hypothetical protein
VAAVALDRAKDDRAEYAAGAQKFDDRGVERLSPVPVGLVDEDAQEAPVFKIVHEADLPAGREAFLRSESYRLPKP